MVLYCCLFHSVFSLRAVDSHTHTTLPARIYASPCHANTILSHSVRIDIVSLRYRECIVERMYGDGDGGVRYVGTEALT